MKSGKINYRVSIDLLDIYGKELIPVISLILLHMMNSSLIKHQSHFNGRFTNPLKVVNYISVRFSKRVNASGIGPFSPLAYRCLLFVTDKG